MPYCPGKFVFRTLRQTRFSEYLCRTQSLEKVRELYLITSGLHPINDPDHGRRKYPVIVVRFLLLRVPFSYFVGPLGPKCVPSNQINHWRPCRFGLTYCTDIYSNKNLIWGLLRSLMGQREQYLCQNTCAPQGVNLNYYSYSKPILLNHFKSALSWVSKKVLSLNFL